jgi:hypothetical protein
MILQLINLNASSLEDNEKIMGGYLVGYYWLLVERLNGYWLIWLLVVGGWLNYWLN